MHKRTTPKIFGRAKQLHRNMTPAEAKLWTHLRAHRLNGVHFCNQHAIGNYVVDFCAPRRKLIIELDGSQHLEQEEYDQEPRKVRPERNRDKAGQANDIPGIKRLSHITLLE